MGAAVFGALLGPVLGATAGVAGARPSFLAVAALGLVLVAAAAATEGVPSESQSLRAAARGFREPRFAAGLWLIMLPALLFGVLVVLVPLRLNDFGWGAVAIGAVFLATTALEVVLNPLLGRYSDRRGRLQPVRIALAGSVLVSVALAWAGRPELIVVLVLAAGLAYGSFYTPALLGPAAGGALADATGDAVPYLIMAGLCATTLAAARPRVVEARA
jgi:hypothetical protein